MPVKKIIVTGASGYIGRYLVSYLREAGHEVIPFVRKADSTKGEVLYDLTSAIPSESISKVDVLVHCAFIPKGKHKNATADNISGTEKLLSVCKEHGVRFIFFSTLSAHLEAESDYGKHKFQLESQLDLSTDAVLKPGLVIGNGGLFGRMLDFSRRFRIIPLIDGGKQPLQFIALADVAACTRNIIEKNLSGSYVLVSQEDHTYRQFYEFISQFLNIRFLYFKIPVNTIVYLLDTFAKMGIPLPVGKENFLGLKNMKFVDPGSDMAKLGVSPMSLTNALGQFYGKPSN